VSPADNGKKKAAGGNEKSGGDVRCFKCGGMGHRFAECKNPTLTCFNFGRTGHHADEGSKDLTCYNFGQAGHISSECQKPKKAQSDGKGFAMINGIMVVINNWVWI
jgi:hypothetical protein